MAARTIPIRTVQPIRRPWVSIAQKIEGCKKRGKGRRRSFQKEVGSLRPLKGERPLAVRIAEVVVAAVGGLVEETLVVESVVW
jgi:predicted transcriptional regulator